MATKRNYKYGKIVNGEIQYAPYWLTVGNRRYVNATADIYLLKGWKLLVYEEAGELTEEEIDAGYYFEPVYTETDTEIIVTFEKKLSTDVEDEE